MTLSDLRGTLEDVRRFEKDMILNVDNAEATAKYLPRWQQAVDKARLHARQLNSNQDDEGARTAAQIDQGLGLYAQAAGPVLKDIQAGRYATVAEAKPAIDPARKAVQSVEQDCPKLLAHLTEEAVVVSTMQDINASPVPAESKVQASARSTNRWPHWTR